MPYIEKLSRVLNRAKTQDIRSQGVSLLSGLQNYVLTIPYWQGVLSNSCSIA